jgi:hypothetical protein
MFEDMRRENIAHDTEVWRSLDKRTEVFVVYNSLMPDSRVVKVSWRGDGPLEQLRKIASKIGL